MERLQGDILVVDMGLAGLAGAVDEHGGVADGVEDGAIGAGHFTFDGGGKAHLPVQLHRFLDQGVVVGGGDEQPVVEDLHPQIGIRVFRLDLCDGVVDQLEYVVVVIAGHTAEIDGGIGAVRHDIGLHAAVEHPDVHGGLA